MLFGRRRTDGANEREVEPAGNGRIGFRVGTPHAPATTSGGDKLPSPEQWALFLDVDGTIVDIAERPDAVVIDPALTHLLLALRQRLGGALALISGRPIAVLDDLLAPARLDAAGLHGLEWRHNGFLHRLPAAMTSPLRKSVDRLRRAATAWDGIIIEDKGATVAVHYRLAPGRQSDVRQLVDAELRELGPTFRLQAGKAVFEIVPKAAGKERAIAHFLGLAPYRDRYPVFAGDDETDEGALALVNEVGGLSVHVGEHKPSIARIRMMSPRVMRGWLAGLAGTIDRTR